MRKEKKRQERDILKKAAAFFAIGADTSMRFAAARINAEKAEFPREDDVPASGCQRERVLCSKGGPQIQRQR